MSVVRLTSAGAVLSGGFVAAVPHVGLTVILGLLLLLATGLVMRSVHHHLRPDSTADGHCGGPEREEVRRWRR